MSKAFVLSSGGIDSTTCIGIAIQNHGKENVSTVSVTYGQRHSKELQCAQAVADYYGLKHYVIDLSSTGIYDQSTCKLLHKDVELAQGSYTDQIVSNENGIVDTYVPFRNGLIVSAVTALAMSVYPDEVDLRVYLGIHADDICGVAAYADCSSEFAYFMHKAILEGTYGHVMVITPLVEMTKADVVKKGLELKVPYELTWSCYEGGDVQCGVCATCIDRRQAFEKNGVKDPVPYRLKTKENK